jgi:fructan beta-fructosidase
MSTDPNATQIYEEKYRPQFHFTSERNWINDPDGLVYYEGEYHLFFQHNPNGNYWGNMTWGHAVSSDLIHWKQLDNAITPDYLGSVFSGSAIVDFLNTSGLKGGNYDPIIAIYTAAGDTSEESRGQPFTQCIAYSNDKGRTWEKYNANPVLPHIVGQNRDPKVLWFEPKKCWIMALYLDGSDFALFRSSNLKHWTRFQTLHIPDSAECPDLFELPVDENPEERRWVFTDATGHYVIGYFDGRKFTIESGPFLMTHGSNFHSFQTYNNIPAEDGRRIQLVWMAGGLYPGMQFNQQMGIPCSLTLVRLPSGIRLRRYPIREIDSLQGPALCWENHKLNVGDNILADIEGELFDISIDIKCEKSSGFALLVGGHEIRFSASNHLISFLGRSMPLDACDNNVRLRVLVDKTSVELFVDDGVSSMSSCYLPKEGAAPLGLFSEGDTSTIISLKVYHLSSIWH